VVARAAAVQLVARHSGSNSLSV